MTFNEIKHQQLAESQEVIANLVHALRLELGKFSNISHYLEHPVPSVYQNLSSELKIAAQIINSSN